MLLSLDEDVAFNRVLSMDVIHNSLIDAFKLFNLKQGALRERLRADEFEGDVITDYLSGEELKVIKPRMIEINMLIEKIRMQLDRDLNDSGEALDLLHQVFRKKLDLKQAMERKTKQK